MFPFNFFINKSPYFNFLSFYINYFSVLGSRPGYHIESPCLLNFLWAVRVSLSLLVFYDYGGFEKYWEGILQNVP